MAGAPKPVALHLEVEVCLRGGRRGPVDRGCGSSGSSGRTGAAEGPGKRVTVQVPPEVSRSGLQSGDSVQLVRAPAGQGQPASYAYFTTDRNPSLFWPCLNRRPRRLAAPPTVRRPAAAADL